MSAAADAGLVWSLAEIVSANRDAFAAAAAPAERLLFFADERARGRYAYLIVDGAARGADVFCSDEATGRRQRVAASLAAYVDQRLDGTLPRDAPVPAG